MPGLDWCKRGSGRRVTRVFEPFSGLAIADKCSADADDRQPQRRRSVVRDDRVSRLRPASIRWYAAPSSGRGSGSPLLGQNAIARSAWAVIVSDGFTPRLAEIAEPSTTCRPGVAVHPLVGVDDAGLGRVADGAAADEVRGQRAVEGLADVPPGVPPMTSAIRRTAS